MIQITKYRKELCGIPTSTMDSKAKALLGCGANHSFEAVKRTGNRNQEIKHQSCGMNLIKATRSFKGRCQLQVKKGWYCKHHKNLKHYRTS